MRVLLLDGSESIEDLASRMAVRPSEVVRAAFQRLGLILTVAERRDRVEMERIAEAFGFAVRWSSDDR